MLIEPPRASTKPARRRALSAAIAIALLIPPAFAAAQTDDEKAAARALATQGGVALNAGKFAEALDLVSRAEQILHAPTHLLMIGRSQVGLGRLVAARETFLKIAREDLAATAPAAFKRAQQDAKDDLTAIEPKIGQLKVDLEGVGQKKITLKMDDQPVAMALIGVYRPVDPGKHEIVAYPAGQAPVKGSVELKDGEKKDIKIVIPDAPASGVPGNPADNPDGQTPDKGTKPPPAGGFFTPLRGVGLGLGVVGVAGVVVGAIFEARGFSLQSDADTEARCIPHCTATQETDIKAKDTSAVGKKNIGLGALIGGGVFLGAGVALFILGKPAAPKPAPKGAYVEPWFSGNAAGLRGAF